MQHIGSLSSPFIFLDGNLLSGSLPTEIGEITSLTELSLGEFAVLQVVFDM